MEKANLHILQRDKVADARRHKILGYLSQTRVLDVGQVPRTARGARTVPKYQLHYLTCCMMNISQPYTVHVVHASMQIPERGNALLPRKNADRVCVPR